MKMSGNYEQGGGFEDAYVDDVPVNVRVPEAEGPFGSFLRRLGSIITGILAMGLVIVLVGGGSYLYLNSWFDAPGPLSDEKTVQIDRGTGLRGIAETLQQEGVIDNDKIFILGVLANRANGQLKAGEYRFEAANSMRAVMDTLVSGRSIQYSFTAPEGLTTLQIIARLEADTDLVGEIERIPEEGALLPNTYAYTRGTSRQSIVDRMSEAQEDLLRELWDNRQEDLPLDRPYDALILASIVEKETGVSSEREVVASVFINRLRRGMRMQSDPTIIYGIVGGEGPLGRSITRDDINTTTPYNTYRIDGLPPTPIANAGNASIAAVLQPAETDYLFFVADGSGGHAFAATLAEHNDNVANWRQIERERRAEDEAAAAAGGLEQPADETTGDATGDDGSLADSEAGSESETGSQENNETTATDTQVNDADTSAAADSNPAPEDQSDTALQEATEPSDAPEATEDTNAGTDSAGQADESVVEDLPYPLPEPKPEVPVRESSTQQPSDIQVVPLPATNPN